MTPAENRSFLAALQALPESIPDHVDPGVCLLRIVLRTHLGTLFVYTSERAPKHDGVTFRAGATLRTLRGSGVEVEAWLLWLLDEPENPSWLVGSVERMRTEDGVDLELVRGWELEEWRALGDGIRNPDTGEALMGWLDADPPPPVPNLRSVS